MNEMEKHPRSSRTSKESINFASESNLERSRLVAEMHWKQWQWNKLIVDQEGLNAKFQDKIVKVRLVEV